MRNIRAARGGRRGFAERHSSEAMSPERPAHPVRCRLIVPERHARYYANQSSLTLAFTGEAALFAAVTAPRPVCRCAVTARYMQMRLFQIEEPVSQRFTEQCSDAATIGALSRREIA